ncbi:MAG: serine hydrolase [Cyclobacteriaceae bacterium]|nr:MAG: serine hydrolase [Cyclobacteriaceae bacterium]
MRKLILRSIALIMLAALSYGIYYAWIAFPIITGYGAKILCSCTMLVGRAEQDVIDNELGSGLLKLGSFKANYTDSSATASVFGLAKRKAIYRKGLGCTLVNGVTEEELRAQNWKIATPENTRQDTLAWPMGDRTSDSLDLSEYNMELLTKTVNEAFEEPGEEKNRRTRAVLIIHHGKIILEKYANGFDQKTRLMGWSMTKSLTNAMMGILVRDEKLTVNQPAPIEDWKNDERSAITIHNLMQASSGLDWQEDYSGPSTATNMLFKKRDAGKYALSVPLKHKPGQVFYYSSGTTNILSWIIRQSVGDETYHRFAYENVFHKIGMNSLVIEPDAGGTFVGSSFSYATARDWARFGLLYLNDGYWTTGRILPEGWVEYTTTPAKGAKHGEYGAQFWLNAGNQNDVVDRTYPDVPSDMFYASGYESQNVFIIPSHDLVVVKLSLTTGNAVDDNLFLKEIIRALPD